MRCSIDGLVAAVAERLKQDAAAARVVYAFANARADRAKCECQNFGVRLRQRFFAATSRHCHDVLMDLDVNRDQRALRREALERSV
jgi:hypothetical protein